MQNRIDHSIYFLTTWYGYTGSVSFSVQICLRFLVPTCSTQISFAYFFLNSRMNRGSHSSDAMPKSLQHRSSALDLHPSPAVGIVSSEKYWHSPRA